VKPTFGTCRAGAILLATKVDNPNKKGSLGALDIRSPPTPTDARSTASIREGKFLQGKMGNDKVPAFAYTKTATGNGFSSALKDRSVARPGVEVIATGRRRPGSRPAGNVDGRDLPSRAL